MAFESRITKLAIMPHPNADRLELAAVGGYRCVVAKDDFRDGDLGAYIPEGAVCPAELVERLGLTGRLAGREKNRVKAVRLRGIVSQGLVHPLEDGKLLLGREVAEGDDVTELLGLTKWEPPIPVHLAGKVKPAPGATLHYDIENVKKWPELLRAGEPVRMTEKIHGTWCCMGWHPRYGNIVTSKGLSDKQLRLALRDEDDQNKRNVYVLTMERNEAAFAEIRRRAGRTAEPFYLLGEIFGQGVQDLQYGQKGTAFRVFDAYEGVPQSGRWIPPEELDRLTDGLFEQVPVLYEGPYSDGILMEHTAGKETVGGGKHVREGAVVRPLTEREDMKAGRVILKSVSDAYLTRKGGTEFN